VATRELILGYKKFGQKNQLSLKLFLSLDLLFLPCYSPFQHHDSCSHHLPSFVLPTTLLRLYCPLTAEVSKSRIPRFEQKSRRTQRCFCPLILFPLSYSPFQPQKSCSHQPPSLILFNTPESSKSRFPQPNKCKNRRAWPGFEPGACHILGSKEPRRKTRSDNHTTRPPGRIFS
jgi:hypothetical protein